MNERDWKAKFEELKKRVAEQPSNGEAWFEFAQFLRRECDMAERVVVAYENAQTLLPYQDLRLQLGGAYVTAGQRSKGISILSEHVKETPTKYGCCILADALIQDDRIDEALQFLKQGIKIDPDFEELYLQMGILNMVKNPSEAVRNFEKAIQLDPNYSLAYRKLGTMLIADHDSAARGIEALQKAVRLDPEDFWAHYYLAKGTFELGDYKNAENYFRLAIALEPDDSDSNEMLNNILEVKKIAS